MMWQSAVFLSTMSDIITTEHIFTNYIFKLWQSYKRPMNVLQIASPSWLININLAKQKMV